MGTFTIRNATPQDTGLIYGFILKMARYEKLESEVDTSEEALRRALFDERQAEVVIGEENGIPVGFALFFHNFSTFRGQRGLYLEDLFVDREHRGKGYGKALLLHLTRIAGWNGRCSTGMPPRSHFTNRWGRFRWMNGPFSGSQKSSYTNWRNKHFNPIKRW